MQGQCSVVVGSNIKTHLSRGGYALENLTHTQPNLYLATEEGDVVVVKMGEKYEVLAVNTLTDQMFIATPAIAGGSIYLCSQEALYASGFETLLSLRLLKN